MEKVDLRDMEQYLDCWWLYETAHDKMTELYTHCTNVNFLALILYYNYVRHNDGRGTGDSMCHQR